MKITATDNPPHPQTHTQGFTLIQLLIVTIIVVAVVVFLFPFLWPSKPLKKWENLCFSHEKQIGAALLMYASDFDDRLPPTIGSWKKPGLNKDFPQDWGASQDIVYGINPDDEVIVPSLLSRYLKNEDLFKCPAALAADKRVKFTYMLNDLSVEAQIGDNYGASKVILLCDGENHPMNVGHAWTLDDDPLVSIFANDNKGRPRLGATVKNAPQRHGGGANYLFCDGHAKWLKSESPAQTPVFFPPRSEMSVAHKNADGKIIGPAPAGDMSYEGRTYMATFQLR